MAVVTLYIPAHLAFRDSVSWIATPVTRDWLWTIGDEVPSLLASVTPMSTIITV